MSNTIAAGRFEEVYQVGGVGLANTLLLIIGQMTIDGLNLNLITHVTQANGRKDYKSAVMIYLRALILLLASFVIIGLILSQNRILLDALQIDEKVANETHSYILMLIPTILFQTIGHLNSYFLVST